MYAPLEIASSDESMLRSQKSRLSYLAVGLLSLTLSLGGLAGCERPGEEGESAGDEKPPDEKPPEEKAAPVKMMKVGTGDIEATISSASTIEAERAVTVHAEATGRVLSLSYEEGDEVKSGAQLAKVRRDAQASGVDRANANYEKAKADVERIERLVARGVASQEELDNTKATLRSAVLDQKDRRRDLRNTKVSAPFGGTITERFVSAGAFVNAGQQLYAITDFNSLVARVYVPEKELDRIRVGQPAQVVGKAAQGREGVGSVMRIAPIVDAATGTLKVTIALPESLAGGDKGFLPGMYAEVTLTTELKEGITVAPKSALVYEEERVFAFIVDEDKAKRVLLEVGLSDDDFVEVLGGLKVGDPLIIAGQSGLKDGALIEVIKEGQDMRMGAHAQADAASAKAKTVREEG
jgi:RND family efflux transporter MFP subunit